MAEQNVGKVVAIIGPVLDIEFPEGKLPAIYNAIEIELKHRVTEDDTYFRMIRERWSAGPGELYVADRLYGTTALLFGLADRGAAFVVRQGDLLRWRPLGVAEPTGRVATGSVREQWVEVEETATGRRVEMRRVILELDTPTEDGEIKVFEETLSSLAEVVRS